jgi:hypothetical protein
MARPHGKLKRSKRPTAARKPKAKAARRPARKPTKSRAPKVARARRPYGRRAFKVVVRPSPGSKKTLGWVRFAKSVSAAVESAKRAVAKEYPTGGLVVSVRPTKDPRGTGPESNPIMMTVGALAGLSGNPGKRVSLSLDEAVRLSGYHDGQFSPLYAVTSRAIGAAQRAGLREGDRRKVSIEATEEELRAVAAAKAADARLRAKVAKPRTVSRPRGRGKRSLAAFLKRIRDDSARAARLRAGGRVSDALGLEKEVDKLIATVASYWGAAAKEEAEDAAQEGLELGSFGPEPPSENPSPETQARVKAAMDDVLRAIERDDAVDMVARTMLAPVPSAKWSINNRLIALAHGTHDARGFRQWIDVGRPVKKGAKAFYILGPRRLTIEEQNATTGATEKKSILAGFVPIPVFRYEDTAGDPLPELTPREPPPLMDVARRMGVSVRYSGGDGLAWGFYRPATDEIVLHTHAASTFFHELAHAAHKRIRGSLKGGQDEEQEIVAEFSAAVLEKMYVPSSHHRLKSHVKYIHGYAKVKGPAEAAKRCMTLFAEIDRVLKAILDVAEPVAANPGGRRRVTKRGGRSARRSPHEAVVRRIVAGLPVNASASAVEKAVRAKLKKGTPEKTARPIVQLALRVRREWAAVSRNPDARRVKPSDLPVAKVTTTTTTKTERRAPEGNPGRGLVRELRGPARAAAHVDGYRQAVAACKEFHGVAPTKVRVFEIDDGKPGVTERVVYAMGVGEVEVADKGDLPSNRIGQVYSVPWKRSRKAGRQYVHSASDDGGVPPLKVCDPQTGITSDIGDYVVTDFIRERKG